MKIIEVMKSFREFLWPILDPLPEMSIKEITLEDCKFSDSEIDFHLKYIEEYKKNEDDRKKEVESKATIFIGTFAVATTVLINLAKEFIFNSKNDDSFLNTIVIVLISLIIIYLCEAIRFSIKALERRNYNILGFPKFMLTDEKDHTKKRQILVRQYNAIKRNQIEINLKVDYMTMAQEFFKRAVRTVFLLTFMFFCNYFVISKQWLENVRDLIKEITLSEYIVVAIAILLMIIIAVICILFSKIKKLENKAKI